MEKVGSGSKQRHLRVWSDGAVRDGSLLKSGWLKQLSHFLGDSPESFRNRGILVLLLIGDTGVAAFHHFLVEGNFSKERNTGGNSGFFPAAGPE